MTSNGSSMLRSLLLVTLLILSGCRFITGDNGFLRDRQGDYLSAQITPDMRIPDELDSYTLDQLYVIPSQNSLASNEFVTSVPRPKPLDTNRPEGVVIQRIGGEAWIVIAASPQQVWPRVRDFWIERGQELDYENPVEGILETAWHDAQDDLAHLAKYRVRIEPGLRPGSSEVYIYAQDRLRITPEPALPVWPAQASNEGPGYTTLEQLSQYLADRTDIYSSSSASLLAGSLAGESKSTLETGADGSSELTLRIGMARAWAQVAQALERAEIPVVDSDRDQGIYNVRFAGQGVEVDKPGFFARVFRGKGNVDDSVPQFSLHIQTTGAGVKITVSAAEETARNRQLEEELLQSVLGKIG